MKTHELKTWPDFYAAIDSGIKTFEIRYDDRGFRAGDNLLLREYEPNIDQYTGRQMTVSVEYVLQSPVHMKDGVVCMSIRKT